MSDTAKIFTRAELRHAIRSTASRYADTDTPVDRENLDALADAVYDRFGLETDIAPLSEHRTPDVRDAAGREQPTSAGVRERRDPIAGEDSRLLAWLRDRREENRVQLEESRRLGYRMTFAMFDGAFNAYEQVIHHVEREEVRAI